MSTYRCRDALSCLLLQVALPQLGELTVNMPGPEAVLSMPAPLAHL